MKRLLPALLLCAAPAFAQANGWQEMQNGWTEIQQVPVSGVPAGCAAGYVTVFLGSPVVTSCDAGLTFDAATNNLTVTGQVSGATLKGTGLTAGRVPLVGTAGLITDDNGLLYNTTTNSLDVTDGRVQAANLKAIGLATPGGITVTPTLTQVGSITTVAGSALVDGDYFTVKYDGGTVPIEFDLSPGDGTTGGRIPLLFTAGDSADLIRDNVILALNAAAPTKLTASSGGAATVALVLDTPGATGDTNTENVADAGFAVTGFADPTHATTVTYQLVACLSDGSCTEPGADSTTGTATATLSAANYNALSWSAVSGAASYKVYRKVAPTSPATVGVIYAGTALAVNDTGLAGDTTTASTVDGTGRVTADGLTIATGAAAGHVLTADAAGNATWQAGGGGITNSAGANVIPKSDGTNLVASALSEASAGAFATSAGTALGLTATAPAATTGASQAGKDVTITASPAVASTDTAGAAAGGNVTITAGDAARRVSGDGNGGSINLIRGNPIGSGKPGAIWIRDASAGFDQPNTGLLRMRVPNNITGQRLIEFYGPDETNPIGSIATVAGHTGTLAVFTDISLTSMASVAYESSTGMFVVGNSGMRLGRSATFGWTTNMPYDTVDTLARRRAAANPAWGEAAASPVAYTHNFAADARAGTDTNVGGANADLAPGVGTGTGGSGQLALQTAYPGSTGTAANTLTDRWFAESVWTDLTESSATNFSKLTYAASTAVGAEWLVTVSANDGTEYQSLTSRVRVSSVRKATGDTVSEINVVGTDLTAASSGTLTCTFTDVEGATGVTVAANCVSSLTQTVLRISYQTTVNGPATVGAP